MSKKKQVTTTTNTGGFQAAPETPEIKILRDMKAKADPTIPHRFATQRQQLNDSYQNPLGSYTPPAVQEAMRRNAGQRLAMDEGQALAESQYNADNTNFQRTALVAQMTQPQYINTGSTQTQQQSGGFWGDVLKAGVA